MEDNIKHILSVFIKVPLEQITDSTPIDRSVINSILLHRLYAKLASEGFIVENYWEVKTFGDLKKRITGNDNLVAGNEVSIINLQNKDTSLLGSLPSKQDGIGIDIEEISSMPRVDDIREDAFYKLNFAATEIAYCILQKNSYASLAGLFATKEAIVKANNDYKNMPFNNIIISHMPQGKPVCEGFTISISHVGNLAVAVAIYNQPGQPSFINNKNLPESGSTISKKQFLLFFLICFLALSLSILSIFLLLKN